MAKVSRIVVAFAFACATAGSSAVVFGAEPQSTHRYRMTIDSKMVMDVQGNQQKIDADTELQYTWQRSGRQRTLVLDSILIKAFADGKQMIDTYMDRTKLKNFDEQGNVHEESAAQAAEPIKSMLRGSFGTLCRLQVDENGKEIAREVVAGPGAKTLIDSGMIANAVLFHPAFMPDQLQWQSMTEVSMGNGGYAKGPLTYKKNAPGGNTVQVTGTLTNPELKVQSGPITLVNKDARYVVSGEQTYDPAQQEWTSGKLSIEIAYQITHENRVIGTAGGTMLVKLTKPPAAR